MRTPKLIFKKVDVVNKEILDDEFFNHTLQKKIELFQEHLKNVDTDQHQLRSCLQLLIQLMKRKLSLRKSMRQLFIIRNSHQVVKPRICLGDEWKIATGYAKSKKKSVAFVEEKCFVNGYRMETIDTEVSEINKKLKYLFDKLDEKYPADFLILEVNHENDSLENRTN